jgi:hypothetical protein
MSVNQCLSSSKNYSSWFVSSVDKSIKKFSSRLLNGLNLCPTLSSSAKFIVIISCIIFCILSYRYLTYGINFKSYCFHNKTKGIKNLTIRAVFHDEPLKISNIELREFSGEYKEVPRIETMNNNDHKYVIEEIYFLLTTNTKRIRHTINFVRFWAKYHHVKCLIVFEEKDFLNSHNIKNYLIHEGIQCEIQTSTVTRYEERYLQLIEQVWNNTQRFDKIKQIQWFAIGDDDTIWFINNLLKTLEQYNSSKLFYLGNISDRNETIKHHGSYYAYGGGGILLSRPLASLFAARNQQCKQFRDMYGGDEMIGKCITRLLNVNLTINKNFYQMDHVGDIYGYLQSGIHGLVSLHHMFSFWDPFPEEHTQTEKETTDIIELAYKTFDYYFLKTYFKINYQTNQTLLWTIGYSFTLFNRILSSEELSQVERTWCCSQMVERTTRPKENNKINWYFKRLTIHHLENRSIYENNERRINAHIPNLELTLIN